MSKKKNSPQWYFIESSHLEAVAYDEGELLVKFKNGAEYKYSDVPEDEFSNMLNAESHGEYFYKHIRNRYEYVKIN